MKYKYNIKKGDHVLRIIEAMDAEDAFEEFCRGHKNPEEYRRGWKLRQYDAETRGGEYAMFVLDMGTHYDVIDVVLRDGEVFSGREYTPSW